MTIYITVPNHKEKEAVTTIETALSNIPNMQISKPQIDATKKKVISNFTRLLEKVDSRATLIAYMIWSGMQQDITDKLIGLYSALTPDDVNTALKCYYNHYYLIVGKSN